MFPWDIGGGKFARGDPTQLGETSAVVAHDPRPTTRHGRLGPFEVAKGPYERGIQVMPVGNRPGRRALDAARQVERFVGSGHPRW